MASQGIDRSLHASNCRGTALDVENMRVRLQEFPNILNKRVLGLTPLISAVSKGHTACVIFLLEKRANVELIVPFNMNALTKATRQYLNGRILHTQIIKNVLDFGANPNVCTVWTPKGLRSLFRIIVEAGKLDLVRMFLDAGADINKGDYFSLYCTITPLGAILGTANINMIKLLLGRGGHTGVMNEQNDIIAFVNPDYNCNIFKELLIHAALPLQAMNHLAVHTLRNCSSSREEALERNRMLREVGLDLTIGAELRAGMTSEQDQKLFDQVVSMHRQPRSLLSMARIQLLRFYGYRLTSMIETFEIPITLKGYLAFDDL